MHFEKVPFEEYLSACPGSEALLKMEWEDIQLPTRATEGAAGYDFYLPYSIDVMPGTIVTMPTGIRAFIDPGYALLLFPRSGLGTKYGFRLLNTIGVVDQDYVNAANYGHIKLVFTVERELTLEAGSRICQGIFVPFGKIDNDQPVTVQRTGGFGSTGA